MRFFAILSFLFFEAALLFSADATVFVYHRFNDHKHISTSISNKKLRSDFKYLKENGYNVVTLSKLVNMLKNHEHFPEKTVALTIDDNYKSFYTDGLKIFKEFDYPFTIYVYVKATEKRYGDYMSWDELKEASRYGEAALHSYSHRHLTYLDEKEILKDTVRAKKIFENKMGYSPKSYAYPYGEFDDKVKSVIKSAGFDFICNQNSGAIAEFSDPYSIERIAVTDNTDIKQKLKLKALDTKKIDIRRSKNTIKNISVEFNDKNIKSAEIYLSGYGWERVKTNNEKLSYNIDKVLKFDRNRVAVKHGDKIATKLIMKRK